MIQRSFCRLPKLPGGQCLISVIKKKQNNKCFFGDCNTQFKSKLSQHYKRKMAFIVWVDTSFVLARRTCARCKTQRKAKRCQILLSGCSYQSSQRSEVNKLRFLSHTTDPVKQPEDALKHKNFTMFLPFCEGHRTFANLTKVELENPLINFQSFSFHLGRPPFECLVANSLKSSFDSGSKCSEPAQGIGTHGLYFRTGQPAAY